MRKTRLTGRTRIVAVCILGGLACLGLVYGLWLWRAKGIDIRSREAGAFFPARTFGPDKRRHEIRAKHPTRLLEAMSEPVMYSKDWAERTACRLLVVPTWGEPTCVRLEKQPDGSCRGTFTVLHPSGGYKTGFKPEAVKRREIVQIGARRWEELEETIKRTGVLGLQSWDDNIGVDGTTSIIEFVKGGRYHAVYRWGGRTENRAFNLVGKVILESVALSRDLLNVSGALKVEDGTVVLVRLQNACGGLRLFDQDTRPEQVRYEWAFRDDGKSLLRTSDVAVKTGSGVATLKEPIEFGPFGIRWSGYMKGWGRVYYAREGRPTTPGLGICVTDVQGIEGIDAGNAKWEYWTSPFERAEF